uniref:Endonuclease/exonuclease/phosphatase domain-containing protein n=1 Tax=Arion vulgaris TaxID=1028688 RepID=A0A0B7BBC5_9EUPU
MTTGGAGAAEIMGIIITCDETQILLYNLYCPMDILLSLEAMTINNTACMVVVISTANRETNSRGIEVEDWEIENNLFLINAPDNLPTFYSRRWQTTSTPDLAFTTNDLSPKTVRMVTKQLGDSDHRPVKLQVEFETICDTVRCRKPQHA